MTLEAPSGGARYFPIDPGSLAQEATIPNYAFRPETKRASERDEPKVGGEGYEALGTHIPCVLLTFSGARACLHFSRAQCPLSQSLLVMVCEIQSWIWALHRREQQVASARSRPSPNRNNMHYHYDGGPMSR